jgi:hypothetical protein
LSSELLAVARSLGQLSLQRGRIRSELRDLSRALLKFQIQLLAMCSSFSIGGSRICQELFELRDLSLTLIKFLF